MKTKPIVAIMYDFDNTLSTRDMQEYSLIPSFGMEAADFWKMSDELAHKNNMDHILSTMLLMVELSKRDGIDMSRRSLYEHGKTIEFHKGVTEWFARMNRYGEKLGLEIRHYIISCGLKPMIEGSEIGKEFANIFACDFVYDENGYPVWPAMAINYSSKIQFLYRINKGVEDIDEHKKLNMYTPEEQRPVPFGNMIYVGDGLTDVPSMKLTRLNGGYSIGVYRHHADSRYLIKDDRVDFYVKADYRENSEIDSAMKAILEKIRTSNHLAYLSGISYAKGAKQNGNM